MTDVLVELFTALVVLPAAVAFLWRYRARRKWRALMDAYADQEIARAWPRPHFTSRRLSENGTGSKSQSRRNIHARPHA
jgi:hypothetical protein